MNTKWQCNRCNEISTDLLVSINPFNPDDEIVGCPYCRAANGFTEICDELKCIARTVGGFPTDEGYRRTCAKHYKYEKLIKEKKSE